MHINPPELSRLSSLWHKLTTNQPFINFTKISFQNFVEVLDPPLVLNYSIIR